MIDPAANLDNYEGYDAADMRLLLTHGHHDHIGAVEALRAKGAKLYMSSEDAGHFDIKPDEILKDGDSILLGDTQLSVIATPGHTPGSVCYYTNGHLFAGDTLFYHNCGRCDLPGGDFSVMLKSLKRLSELPGDTVVYPGHDRFSTIADEQRHNPYMKEAIGR